MTESFFIYKLEYLFIFSDISFKIPGSNPLYNKKKPCLKYHLIFFFCNFIKIFFCLQIALWKELPYERSRAEALGMGYCSSNAWNCLEMKLAGSRKNSSYFENNFPIFSLSGSSNTLVFKVYDVLYWVHFLLMKTFSSIVGR